METQILKLKSLIINESKGITLVCIEISKSISGSIFYALKNVKTENIKIVRNNHIFEMLETGYAIKND